MEAFQIRNVTADAPFEIIDRWAREILSQTKKLIAKVVEELGAHMIGGQRQQN